jgi:predicted transcriptional regulator
MKVGTLSKDDYIRRTKAIATGHYKPRRGEPKIWFESLSKPLVDMPAGKNHPVISP